MAELLVAHVLWLLGQDEEWMRPRAGALPVAAAAGALVDVVQAGAAAWVDGEKDTAVATRHGVDLPGILGEWACRLGDAAKACPIPVIHAINAVSPNLWDSLGADLAQTGQAREVPRPVRRWLPPRRRPDTDLADRTRAHLRDIVDGRTAAGARDLGLLSAAYCAGVVEHVLSATAFTDSSMLAPTRSLLEGNDVVRRLEPAVSYLVSMGPALGSQPSWPGSGLGS